VSWPPTCFTVETAWLRTPDVLFVIEVHTRCVHIAGATRHPDTAWVTQQARTLSFDLSERGPFQFLIRDRDAKYPRNFDAVFAADGMRVVLTPFRAPQANALAERWVRTVRRECLDWTLVVGRRHLERVLREYVAHYNARRPHRGLDLRAPDAPSDAPTPAGTPRGVRRRDILGGLIHESNWLHEAPIASFRALQAGRRRYVYPGDRPVRAGHRCVSVRAPRRQGRPPVLPASNERDQGDAR
jgi:putative transposase